MYILKHYIQKYFANLHSNLNHMDKRTLFGHHSNRTRPAHGNLMRVPKFEASTLALHSPHCDGHYLPLQSVRVKIRTNYELIDQIMSLK